MKLFPAKCHERATLRKIWRQTGNSSLLPVKCWPEEGGTGWQISLFEPISPSSLKVYFSFSPSSLLVPPISPSSQLFLDHFSLLPILFLPPLTTVAEISARYSKFAFVLFCYITNHLMTGPLGNSEFCFPRISMFPSTSSRETLRFSGNKIHCSPRDQSLSVKSLFTGLGLLAYKRFCIKLYKLDESFVKYFCVAQV